MRLPEWITAETPAAVAGRQLFAACAALLLGFVVMPGLIYLCGVSLLGRYEGAGLEQTYRVLIAGLGGGSVACWVVVLGPYGLYWLARLLRVWWRAGAVGA